MLKHRTGRTSKIKSYHWTCASVKLLQSSLRLLLSSTDAAFRKTPIATGTAKKIKLVKSSRAIFLAIAAYLFTPTLFPDFLATMKMGKSRRKLASWRRTRAITELAAKPNGCFVLPSSNVNSSEGNGVIENHPVYVIPPMPKTGRTAKVADSDQEEHKESAAALLLSLTSGFMAKTILRNLSNIAIAEPNTCEATAHVRNAPVTLPSLSHSDRKVFDL